MSGSVTKISHVSRPEWRQIMDGSEAIIGAIHQDTNGGTPDTGYGEILAGTIMGRLSNGELRPAAAADLINPLAAANVVDVDDASNFFPGDVVDMVENTPLADPITTIFTGRNVTNVDKTSTPNTVTFDGGAASAAVGDVLRVQDQSAIPVGILETQMNTLELIGSTPTHQKRQVSLALRGHAVQSRLTGFSATLDKYLAGGVVKDALGEVVSDHAGFVVRNV